MDWTTFITSVIPLIAFVVGALISYIYRKQDKSDDSTQETLKEIKELITTINLNLTSTSTTLERSVKDTEALQKGEKDINSKLNILEKNVAILTEIRRSDDKRLDLLQQIVTKHLNLN